MASISTAVNAAALASIEKLSYRGVIADGGSTRNYTAWQVVDSNQSIPQKYKQYQLKGEMVLVESTPQPLGLFINVLGSYRVEWDGEFIGENGQIGQTEESEIAGQIDSVFLVPSHLATRGSHTVVLTISRQHMAVSDSSSFIWMFATDYETLSGISVKRALVPMVMSGATLLIFIYLSYLYFSLSKAPVYLLYSALYSLCLLLLMTAESWRGLVGYPYYWHEWRLAIVTLLTLLTSLVLLQFILNFFRYTKTFQFACTALFLVCAVVALATVASSDIQSLLFVFTGAGISLVVSLVACSQRKPYAKLLLLVLVIFLAPASLGLLDFTDRYFFVSSGVLLAFVLYVQGRSLKDHERQLAKSELTKTRLELELVKRNIQPHFILNTLTAVEEWIEESPSESIKFIHALAQEFRHIAQLSQRSFISLSEEIALCESHMAVMEYRTANQFVLHKDILDSNVQIPPGIVLTLVENGISHFPSHNKHCEFAICQRFQSGKIDITFTAVGNQTTMKPQSSALGTGMGSQYIFARMNEAYQDDWHYSIAQNEESWSFTVSFPSTKNDGSGHD